MVFIKLVLYYFQKDTSFISGKDLNYNNRINFSTNRNYSGFSLKCNLVERNNESIFTGYSYMLPNAVALKGYYNNKWYTLDAQSGLRKLLLGKLNADGTRQPPTVKSNQIILDPSNALDYNSANDNLNTPVPDLWNNVNYAKGLEDAYNQLDENYPLDTILDGTITGATTIKTTLAAQFAIPTVVCNEPYTKYVNITTYENTPTGFKCNDAPPDLPSGVSASGSLSPLMSFNLLRTGTNMINIQYDMQQALNDGAVYDLSKVKTVNNKYDKIANSFNIANLAFDAYKLEFSEFEGFEERGLIPMGAFYIKQINLFGAGAGIPKVYAGGIPSIIGSAYSGLVAKYVQRSFDSGYNYSITPLDSGVFKNTLQFKKTIIGQDLIVNFKHETGYISGAIVSGSTNLFYKASGNPTNRIYDTFYDPATKLITFYKDVSGEYTDKGSGVISGFSATIINTNLLNKASFFGLPANASIVNNQFYIMATGTGASIYDNITIDNYINNTLGYFNLTGSFTGSSISGYISYTGLATGSGIYVNDTNYPYYPMVTGYRTATAKITLNTGGFTVADYLSINNKTISYNSDTINYTAPDFFYTPSDLLNIINDNPLVFYCVGSLNSNVLTLSGALKGASGNSIAIGSGNGTGFALYSNTLTGGVDYNLRLYPSTNFSGYGNTTIAVTGYSTGIASGTINGNINKYLGKRNFSDIWAINTGTKTFGIPIYFTGLSPFNTTNSGLLSGNINYINNTGYTATNNNVGINMTYSNIFTDANYDVADLTVRINNFGISGNIISGSTFRLSGI